MKKTLAVLLVILLVLPIIQPASSLPVVSADGLRVGDTVEVQNTGATHLAVRNALAGTEIARMPDRSQGEIIGGP